MSFQKSSLQISPSSAITDLVNIVKLYFRENGCIISLCFICVALFQQVYQLMG